MYIQHTCVYGTFVYTCVRSTYIALMPIRVHIVRMYIWHVCIYVCPQYIYSTDANSTYNSSTMSCRINNLIRLHTVRMYIWHFCTYVCLQCIYSTDTNSTYNSSTMSCRMNNFFLCSLLFGASYLNYVSAVLQCVAVYCSVLQCVTVCCSML